MKTLFLSLIFCFLSISNIYSKSDEGDLSSQISNDEIIYSDKNPALSFTYSLLLPGLGQMYNEEISKGFLLLSGSITGGILIMYSINYLHDDDTEVALTLTGAALIIFCEMYSIIDAPIQSANINKRNRINRIKIFKKYGHLISYDFQKTTIGFDLDYNKIRGFNVGITYHY